MSAILDLQIATDADNLPAQDDIQRWLDAVLADQNMPEQEITVRIVDPLESQQLNREFRDKDTPTNVLSFPFDAPDGIEINLLGDLVICAEVVAREAQEQSKPLQHHWAHMVIHGALHLLGFDHINDEDADVMEKLEIRLLGKFSIDDPYQDH